MLVRLLSVSVLAALLVIASFAAMGRTTAPATIYAQTVRDAPWMVPIPSIWFGRPICCCNWVTEPPQRPARPPSFLSEVTPEAPPGWESYSGAAIVNASTLPVVDYATVPPTPEFVIVRRPWWAFWR